MVFRQFFSCPQRCKACNRIKVAQIGYAGTSLVMVAAYENRSQLARTRGHLIRICAVADDIAQVIDLVVFGSGVQASLQRFKVGMDVRQNQYAQSALKSSIRKVTNECINIKAMAFLMERHEP